MLKYVANYMKFWRYKNIQLYFSEIRKIFKFRQFLERRNFFAKKNSIKTFQNELFFKHLIDLEAKCIIICGLETKHYSERKVEERKPSKVSYVK